MVNYGTPIMAKAISSTVQQNRQVEIRAGQGMSYSDIAWAGSMTREENVKTKLNVFWGISPRKGCWDSWRQALLIQHGR